MLQIHPPSLGIRDARLTRLLADWEVRRRAVRFYRALISRRTI